MVALVGALGVLALSASGAQSGGTPVPLAFQRKVTPPEPRENESYYYDAIWHGAPTSATATLPVVTVSTAPGTPAGLRPFGFTNTAPLTASGIPEPAYRAYVNAAAELSRTDPACHLSWTVIAGIGRVESNHGRFGGSTITASGLVTPPILGIRLDGSRPGTAAVHDTDDGRYDGDTVYDRAVGPMQFLPGTWKTYGAPANPQNMNDAALATARYLCAGGGSMATQAGRWAAVYRYNRSDSYVSLVLSLADSYATGQVTTFPARPPGSPPPNDSTPPATAPGLPPSLPPVPPAPSTPPVIVVTLPGRTVPATVPPTTVPPTTVPPTTVPPTTVPPTTVPPATVPPTTVSPTKAPPTTTTTTPTTTTPPASTAPPTKAPATSAATVPSSKAASSAPSPAESMATPSTAAASPNEH